MRAVCPQGIRDGGCTVVPRIPSLLRGETHLRAGIYGALDLLDLLNGLGGSPFRGVYVPRFSSRNYRASTVPLVSNTSDWYF